MAAGTALLFGTQRYCFCLTLVAQNRVARGLGFVQTTDRGLVRGAFDKLRDRVFAVVQNRLGAVRNVGVAVHADADVLLVGLCVGKADNFVHQIAGRQRTHPSNDPDDWIHDNYLLVPY